jgi:hypothetical protein
VARIRSSLITNDDLGVLGETVHDLSLALVPPLTADDDNTRHSITILLEVNSRSATSWKTHLINPFSGLQPGAKAALGHDGGRFAVPWEND